MKKKSIVEIIAIVILALLIIVTPIVSIVKNNKDKTTNGVTLTSLNVDSNVSENYIKPMASTTVDYQYAVILKDTTTFELTIILDNDNDYHILDFKLVCDNENANAQVLIDDEFKALSEVSSINWKGDTNKKYTIEMKLDSVDYLNTLTISDILYVDKTNESITYTADTNNKGNIDIYVVNGVSANWNSDSSFVLVANDEHIDTTSIIVNGVEYEYGSIYTAPDDKSDLIIVYTYVLKDGTTYNATNYITRENFLQGYTYVEWGFGCKVSGRYLKNGDSVRVALLDEDKVSLLEDTFICSDEYLLEVDYQFSLELPSGWCYKKARYIQINDYVFDISEQVDILFPSYKTIKE